ncbi:phosphotransferase [Paenibacillus lycopersici]|uniref:Phosphotransferase n=1 Tax=Paenibacillus lycopersici TaxID=2704462 RepID=A0A6C0FX36_9BACL|nr:aminoglycoside phosphotransferase family protein [Paenibacillus lycopersici]QHT59854.1 phosphotransferase [Paenibacillus lycopersici]
MRDEPLKTDIVRLAERIAADYLGEPAMSAYQILGKGFVNQVCVVETARRKVVVRMNGSGAYACYKKERWCIEQAAAAGIPGPEVLSIGIAADTAYMLLTFVEGCNGTDSLHPRTEIWRQLGEYAGRMQAIPTQGYGEELADPALGLFRSPPHAGSDGSWLGYVQYNIRSLTDDDRLLALGVVTRAESQRARRLFEQVSRTVFGFGLNHGDLSLKNTIVDHAGQVILLDWGSAEAAVSPHGQLVQVMQSRLQGEGPNAEEFSAFLDGYGIREGIAAEAKPLLLLRAFDKLRWALDRSPDLADSYAAYARQVVAEVLG